MTAPLVLGLFILVVSALGSRVLATAAWPTRAPALGILAWQALTVAVALAVVFAGVAIALPQLYLTIDLARLMQACVDELRHQYGTPAGALLSGTGVTLSVGVLGRFGVLLMSGALNARRARSRHNSRLEMLTHLGSQPGVTVIDHEVPMAYCLPGRGRRVVVTRGATEVLTEGELNGVLAHERAHLRARHHLATLVAGALSRTFFDLGLFALARDRISELIEMHADDAAGAERRRDLASALMHLSGLGTPIGALGAAGAGGAIARIVRLSRPQDPLPRSAQLPIVLSAAVVVVIPMLLTMIPVGVALVADCCGAGGLPPA